MGDAEVSALIDPAVDFGLVAAAMRDAVIEFYEGKGRPLDNRAGRRTVDTNSGDAPARGALLLGLLAGAGVSSVAGLHIADVGCGFGPLALYFAALGATVTGVDAEADQLAVGQAVAQTYALPATFLPGRLEELPLPSGAFDVVIINNAFCYLTGEADRRRGLGHALRILAPGGWLVTRDPNRLHPLDPFTRLPAVHRFPPTFCGRVAAGLRRPRPRVQLASARQFARALRRAGFEDVRVVGHRPARFDWAPQRYARYHHAVARRPDRARGRVSRED